MSSAPSWEPTAAAPAAAPAEPGTAAGGVGTVAGGVGTVAAGGVGTVGAAGRAVVVGAPFTGTGAVGAAELESPSAIRRRALSSRARPVVPPSA